MSQFAQGTRSALGHRRPDALLAFSTLDKSFDDGVKCASEPDDAMAAVEQMQIGNGIAGKAPVINRNHILGNGGDERQSNRALYLLARMEPDVHYQVIEHIIGAQDPCRRHPAVLVLMPAEMLSNPGFIGQAKPSTITGPQAEPPPAESVKVTIE